MTFISVFTTGNFTSSSRSFTIRFKLFTPGKCFEFSVLPIKKLSTENKIKTNTPKYRPKEENKIESSSDSLQYSDYDKSAHSEAKHSTGNSPRLFSNYIFRLYNSTSFYHIFKQLDFLFSNSKL